MLQHDAPTTPSASVPLAFGVIAAGITAVGAAMVASPSHSVGSHLGGMGVMMAGVIAGRVAFWRAIERAMAAGDVLWDAMAHSRAGRVLSEGRSGKVISSLVGIGSWVSSMQASTPMAIHGPTLANGTLAFGVAATALTLNSMLDRMQRVHAPEEPQEKTPKSTRRSVGM